MSIGITFMGSSVDQPQSGWCVVWMPIGSHETVESFSVPWIPVKIAIIVEALLDRVACGSPVPDRVAARSSPKAVGACCVLWRLVSVASIVEGVLVRVAKGSPEAVEVAALEGLEVA
jgi:hypothetical protein